MGSAKNLRALAGALIALFLLNSCVEFFSTSWGELFKRDPKNVKVTSSNVYDLLDAAKGDPELSRAILDQIHTSSSDDDTLKRAAIKAANQAMGVSTLALQSIGDLIDAADSKDKDALKNIVDTFLLKMTDTDAVGISEELTAILNTKVKTQQFSEPSQYPKAALINAGNITVSAPMTAGGNATIKITGIDNNGRGTVTITDPNGDIKNYSCTINDNAIILENAGEDGGNVSIPYTIHDENRSLTITGGLNNIKDANLTDASAHSAEDSIPKGKPEFEDGFLDSVPESDLTLLVMTLILAKVEKEKDTGGSLDAYIDKWTGADNGGGKDVQTGNNLDAEELVIASVINVMMDRGDDMSELTKMIKDLLGVK
jgi:hypothetical protein